MPIIFSSYTVGHEQADGTRKVREIHLDHNGVEYDTIYWAEPGMDYDLIMQERIQALNDMIDPPIEEEPTNG